MSDKPILPDAENIADELCAASIGGEKIEAVGKRYIRAFCDEVERRVKSKDAPVWDLARAFRELRRELGL